MEIRKIATNRRARHEYFIEETIEAGIVLTGTEVKALRLGKGNLNDSYAQIKAEEVFLYNCHISPYEYGNRFNHDPLRPRKLLLHKAEIRKLAAKIKEKGYTLVPLSMYFDRKNRVRSSWRWPKVRNSTINAMTLPSGMRHEMARALKENLNIRGLGGYAAARHCQTSVLRYKERPITHWGRLVSTGSMMTGVAGRGAVASLNCSKHNKCR